MLTVGIDVGGTNVRAGVVDAKGVVLDTVRTATPGTDGELEDAIAAVTRELAGRHPVAAVGLAVAGFVTADRLRVRFAPHLSWRDAPVADRVRERLGLPVVLEHDGNAAAVAEYRYGAARGGGVVVLIALGTGIGGALLVDGEVYRGAFGVAPELGHLRLVPGGRQCPCGKRGCWERYCSGTALAATAVELLAMDPDGSSLLGAPGLDSSTDPGSTEGPTSGSPAPGPRPTDGPSPPAAFVPGRLTGRQVAEAAACGDPLAISAMSELARWLGEGLAIVADVYDPELVVIGGGVSDSASLFLDEAREHYAASVTGAGHRPLARVEAAQLGGGDAGMIGVAALAGDLVL